MFGSCWAARRWQSMVGTACCLSQSFTIIPLHICYGPFIKKKKFLNLVLIHQTEGSTTPACPSRMQLLNKSNIKGSNSSKMCVWCLCTHVLSYVCVWTDFVCWTSIVLTYEKSFNMCIDFGQSLSVLRQPGAIGRTLESSYWLTNVNWTSTSHSHVPLISIWIISIHFGVSEIFMLCLALKIYGWPGGITNRLSFHRFKSRRLLFAWKCLHLQAFVSCCSSFFSKRCSCKLLIVQANT